MNIPLVPMPKRGPLAVLDLRPLQCGYAGRGIGRYTLELARRLPAILAKPRAGGKPGFRVFSLVLEGRDIPVPEIPVLVWAPPWKRMWLWDQFVLPLKLFRHRVRAFHNFVTLGPLDRVSFPGRYGFRSLATVHDWHMFADDASPVEKFYRGTRRIRMQLKGLAKARRVVVDSEQIKVETIMRSGVDGRRIAIVPLGGDHLDLVPAEPWPMENFALSVGDTPNKNLAFARDALALLRSRYVHINWVVAGNRKAVLEQLGYQEADLPSWITILENPSDGLLKACYHKALCLLFPSTREGFGIPVLEAMRMGCPVLASNLEPLRSLVGYSHGMVRPDNREEWCEALARLLHSPEARQESIAAGMERARPMTWDAAAEALAFLYL